MLEFPELIGVRLYVPRDRRIALRLGVTTQAMTDRARRRQQAIRGLLHERATAAVLRAARAHDAPCAVAVAPAGYAERPVVLSEIGVGYDGSRESEARAHFGARVRECRVCAKVSAFEAVSLLFEECPATAAAIDRLVKEARERIAALGDVEPHAAYGEAAEELALYGALSTF